MWPNLGLFVMYFVLPKIFYKNVFCIDLIWFFLASPNLGIFLDLLFSSRTKFRLKWPLNWLERDRTRIIKLKVQWKILLILLIINYASRDIMTRNLPV